MDIVSFVSQALAIAVIFSQILITAFIVYILFFRKKYPAILQYFSKYGILFSFIIALGGVIGSLFYSNIAGFAPCELCWFQRIFLYPLVVILGLAILKKDTSVVDYVLSLSVVGLLIAAYQNYLNYIASVTPSTTSFCSIGGGTSCAITYIVEYGYITIPVMSFTAFSLIIIFLLCKKYERH